MYKIPRVNVIESDEGFSVEVLGQTGINYTEGDRHILIDSEMLAGPAGLILYTKSIKSWDSKILVNNVDRDRIVDNIKKAFRYRGIEIQVI